MPISKTWPSGGTSPTPTTYQIPLNTELNWTSLTTFLQALADSAQGTSFQKFALRVAVSSPIAVVATTDCVVVSDLTVAGAVTINLPAGADKQLYFIMDGKGDAATNNITINRAVADTIKGATSLVIDRNYGGVILAYNASTTDWKVFGPFITPGGVLPADFVGILPTTKGGTGVNGTAVFPGSGTVAIYPIDLTTDVSGILPAANGGTGIASLGAGVATWLGTPSSSNLAAAVTDETGSGALVFGTSPTITSASLVTPALGTPASGVMTNVTGLPLTTGVTGVLPEANGGTGISALGAGVATWLGTPSSANLASAVTDETGTGSLVFATSPTLVTPALGTPSSGVATNLTGLPLSTGVTGTLPILNGGTGQTTANTALNALLPSQAANANKFLQTNGTNTLWATASGGAGEVNAVLNASGSDGTTGWTGVTVVSGASSPLNPIITTAFSISNTATPQTSTTDGYYPFTMPTGLMNKKLKVEFTFTSPATDVYQVSVYKGTTRVPLTTDASGVTALPANTTGKFTAYFDSDNSASWTVGVTRTSGATGALIITNVIVGPGIQPQGAVVSEWQSYTPTFTGFGVAVGISFSYRRNATSIEIRGNWTTGVPTATEARISIPTGLNSLGSLPTLSNAGVWVTAATADTRPKAVLIEPSVNYMTFGYNQTIVGELVKQNGNVTFGSVVAYSLFASFPIAEWAGSGTVNLAQNDIQYLSNSDTSTSVSNTTAFTYGPSGNSIVAVSSSGAWVRKRVQLQVGTWTATGGTPVVKVSPDGLLWLNAVDVFPANEVSGLFYGIDIQAVGANTVDIAFGGNGATSVAPWSSFTAYKWRVDVAQSGQAVGYGIVVPGTSSGLVSASGLPGNTTGNAIASGYVGQIISQDGTPVSQTSSQATDAGCSPILLTPGIWDIQATISYVPAGTTLVTKIYAFIGTVTGNNITGIENKNLTLNNYLNLNPGDNIVMSTPVWRVNVTTNTNYYVKAYALFSTSTLTAQGYITARRTG